MRPPGRLDAVDRRILALAIPALATLVVEPLYVLDGVLMGGADFAYVKWVTVASLAVYVPFAAAVLASHELGITVIWVGLLVWITARAALNWVRFRGPRWTVISVTEPPNSQPSAVPDA